MRLFHSARATDAVYAQLASLLQRGGVIAYPTDTAYGLGADPSNPEAVSRIFSIKGRIETKPILLIVDSIVMAESVSKPSEVFYRVSEKFWPGPLTLVVEASPALHGNITAGTRTIGIRWPAARFATLLASRFGKPITATSANRSGMPSAATADEVRAQLGESIDALVDGGALPSPGGSSLLDLTASPPVLLREGPVTFATLSDFFKGNIRRPAA